MKSCALMVALLALPLGGDATAKKGLADLQGTWKLMSVEENGNSLDFADAPARLVIKGDRMRYGGEDVALLTADPAASPRIIDLSLLKPKKVLEGIYTADQDTLKICVNIDAEGVKQRPQELVTKGKQNLRLLVFERARANERDTTEGLRGFVGLALRLDANRGEVSVNAVLPDSPAKKGGLQKDDVVLKIGATEVSDLRGAVETVRQAKPGSKLSFRIRRDGKERDLTITIGVLPFSALALLD
jgi:uncharacterized protein (TIGR03067 family)